MAIAGFLSPWAMLWECNWFKGASCIDPSKYISWEGIYYTEAANQRIANSIMDGSISDHPISITKACGNLSLVYELLHVNEKEHAWDWDAKEKSIRHIVMYGLW